MRYYNGENMVKSAKKQKYSPKNDQIDHLTTTSKKLGKYSGEWVGFAGKKFVAHDKDARILLCSAIGFDDEVEAGFKAGARALILKPFMPNEIRETIEKVLHEAG